MRVSRAASAVAVVISIATVATVGSAMAGSDGAGPNECQGLSCAEPGNVNAVPEARGPVPSVSGPDQLRKQQQAGFYQYGGGADVKGHAVAYVAKGGQLDSVPASVRNLPVMRDTEKEGGLAVYDTIVVFGPDAALFVERPAGRVGEARKKSSASRKRARGLARAAESPPNYGCADNYFCIYRQTTFNADCLANCDKAVFGPSYTGNGFYRLSAYGFNDMARSMRNRRDRDSLLAQHWNGSTGTGTRYCADSHSSDTTFHDNAIGWDQASAVANVPDDIHC